MKPSLYFASVAGAVGLLSCSARAQGPGITAKPPEPTIQSGGEVAAATAIEVWLGLVDDGRYPDSWQSASALFKKVIDQDAWVDKLKTYRAPLGKLVSRKVKSRQFAKTLPGAPDGQYVVLQYDTVLESKKVAVETVTAVLDVDGQWRVTGYYVK